LNDVTLREFKKWLTENKSNDIRQKKLAPILRSFAINNIATNYDNEYKANYEALLIAAYERFMLNDYDDTFCPHEFINLQFSAIRQQNLSEVNYKELLLDWWRISGKNQYFENINSFNKIDITKWGSEVELDVLASFIGINICWTK